MDLNRLRLFHVVAQHGSYSRAAEALDLSQPSVSVQVHQLERALGTYLFYQVGRKLQLTEEGRLLLKYADQIFALEQRAESAVRELSGLEQGHLVVGASSTVGTYMLPKVLSEFYRRHPGVEVALEMGTSLEAQEHILGNEQDIAFVGRNPPHHPPPKLGAVLCYFVLGRAVEKGGVSRSLNLPKGLSNRPCWAI